MTVFDSWRIIPRLMGLTFLWISLDVWFWYSSLEVTSNTDAGTLVGVLGVTVGFCKFYMETGNKP